jgi:hypothetical protein
MIIVASPSKPFTYTAKMTARRQAVLREYEMEIESAYVAAEESAQLSIIYPHDWTEESSRDFVRSVVHTVLKRSVGDTDDLFQNGCDRYEWPKNTVLSLLISSSLQATWIRNAIFQAIRNTTGGDVRALSPSVVYERPTISSLADYVFTFAQSTVPAAGAMDSQTSIMQDMVTKYMQALPRHTPGPLAKSPEGDVILLTGTTGGLGAEILTALARDPNILKVYAINRPNHKTTVKDRQRAVLDDRGLNTDVLDSLKVHFIESDLSLPGLGIQPSMLNEVSFEVFAYPCLIMDL